MSDSNLEYPHIPLEPARSRAARIIPVVTFVLFFIGMSSAGNSDDAWGNRRGFEIIWSIVIAWIAARITGWLQRLCAPPNDSAMVAPVLLAWLGLVAEAMILAQWASHKLPLSVTIDGLSGVTALDVLWIAYSRLVRTIPALRPGMRPTHSIKARGLAMGAFGVCLLGLLACSYQGKQKAREWSFCLMRRSQIATLGYCYFERHQKVVLGGKSAIELLYRDHGEPPDEAPQCSQGGSYAFVKLADGSVAIECSCPDHGDVEAGTLGLANDLPTITTP